MRLSRSSTSTSSKALGVIGSVAKGYHGRFIFRVDDLDGDDRIPGERHVKLVNKKASFMDEGQQMPLTVSFGDGVVRFKRDGSINTDEGQKKDPHSEVKVRQALADGDKTKEQIHIHSGLALGTLSNLLPRMVKAKTIRVVDAGWWTPEAKHTFTA